jgi:hypothetical protein
MALSDKDKHKVVYYLGWTGTTLIAGNVHYNSVVNDRLIDLNTYIESLTKGLLERLDMIEESLTQARCRLAAASVDNITMNEREIEHLKKEKRRLIRELSDHLDIPIMKSGGGNTTVLV